MDKLENSESQKLDENKSYRYGTLAIDLGNSTTVVAFQEERKNFIELLDIPPLSRVPGEIPSVIWHPDNENKNTLVGNSALTNSASTENKDINTISDFKRWICAPNKEIKMHPLLSAEMAGELLIQNIWNNLPNSIKVKRLVLTAPVETYREYRTWLLKVCSRFDVKEIALVDEPTAAAMGAELDPGSKILVIDIGGSTIDMSIVVLEGGEGKAEPIAQLLRFGGNNIIEKSKQTIRCAKVLGKAGIRLGGRDIDRWIINKLLPEEIPTETLLNCAEKLKCRLSNRDLKDSIILTEEINFNNSNELKYIKLCKMDFENILKDNGLIETLKTLFSHTLKSSKLNGVEKNDLDKVVIVGGGSRIPLIINWLKEECNPIELITPPSIEAVVKGALYLTPGVQIKDVLQKGVSLRCWDKKNNIHMWHPLFLAGQPWPTIKPLEIILAGCYEDQSEIEIITGEPDFEGVNEIIYKNGIPTLKKDPLKPIINDYSLETAHIKLIKATQPGEDCLKLNFEINDKCELIVSGTEISTSNKIEITILRSIR